MNYGTAGPQALPGSNPQTVGAGQKAASLKSPVNKKEEGHDGPVSLHWLICEIHSYQTLHYLGTGLKHKTPYKD